MTTGSQAAVAPSPGDGPHLTLQDLHDDLVDLRSRLPAAHESSELEALSRKLKRSQRVAVPLMWVVGIAGTIFSAGMAWAVFVGENATETEVQAELAEHNGAPVSEGPHPELTKALEEHDEEIGVLKEQTKALGDTQDKLDKRSLYQFEFSRWQADVNECAGDKRCLRRNGKPQNVKDLESDLMND